MRIIRKQTINIRQKDHRSDGCSHSKRKINAFDDLYDGTVIYPIRGIDCILNQRQLLCGVRIMDYLKMIIFFLILTTLIDQLCDKSIYRPYLRLMTGFMLISLMMQPISYYLSNEDIVTQAISTAVKGENNPAFLDGAKEEKQNQIKEQITTLFSQYDLKVLDVDSKVNEKGTIEKIDIKTDKLRHTKKLKTAISNFYNMKESNINISE